MTPTYQWLRDLGAIRPQAPTGHHILVLGEWTHGVYPIEWQRREGPFIKTPEGRVTGRESIETWRVLGISTAQPLTREDCKRILKAMKGTK